jgi:hypothetical protein
MYGQLNILSINKPQAYSNEINSTKYSIKKSEKNTSPGLSHEKTI